MSRESRGDSAPPSWMEEQVRNFTFPPPLTITFLFSTLLVPTRAITQITMQSSTHHMMQSKLLFYVYPSGSVVSPVLPLGLPISNPNTTSNSVAIIVEGIAEKRPPPSQKKKPKRKTQSVGKRGAIWAARNTQRLRQYEHQTSEHMKNRKSRPELRR